MLRTCCTVFCRSFPPRSTLHCQVVHWRLKNKDCDQFQFQVVHWVARIKIEIVIHSQMIHWILRIKIEKKRLLSTSSSPLPLHLQCLLQDQGVATVLFALKVDQIKSLPLLQVFLSPSKKRLTNVVDVVGSAISILPLLPACRQRH